MQEKKESKNISIKNKNFDIDLNKIDNKSFEEKFRNLFIQSFQNNDIFESSNEAPIMNIEKKKGDLTYKYLDISKYFFHGKSKVNFSFNIN